MEPVQQMGEVAEAIVAVEVDDVVEITNGYERELGDGAGFDDVDVVSGLSTLEEEDQALAA